MRYLFVIILGVSILFYACNNDPSAQFEVSSSSVAPGDAVEFTNTSTNSVNYEWNFGDGYSSHEVNPVHKYEQSGSYEVVLKAYTEDYETSSEATQTITVTKTTEEKISNGKWQLDSIYHLYFDNNQISPGFAFVDTLRPPSSIIKFESDQQVVFTDSLGTKTAGSWGLLEDKGIQLSVNIYRLPMGYYKIMQRSSSKLYLRRRDYQGADSSKWEQWNIFLNR